MKISATILSFFILFLAAFPCEDDFTFDTETSISIISAAHDHDTDACSPFCVCQCCQSNVLVSIPLVLTFFEEPVTVYYPYLLKFQGPDIFDFLIPPKSYFA